MIGEYRVALTPSLAAELASLGAGVLIERGAGEGCGFPDEEYRKAGARIAPDREAIYDEADIVVKVKEPQPAEVEVMRRGQVVFCFLHLAANQPLIEPLCRAGVVAIGFETVETEGGQRPLLSPMSTIAGRLAPQIGAHFLEKTSGGSGVLLSSVDGVDPGSVVILGAGKVGINAARIALGLGANVTLLDMSESRLEDAKRQLSGHLATAVSSAATVRNAVTGADLVVGAVYISGAPAPHLVSRAMLARMRPGSVFVDVSIDQGGCAETSRPTSHEEPVFVAEGVLHYCVPNIPSKVARTAALALNAALRPYLRELVLDGWQRALESDSALGRGVNIRGGEVIHPAVAALLKTA